MRIGLFGGSFDPVHNSHVKIAREVLNMGIVDAVWVVPCFFHNFGKRLIPFDDRVDMLNLAFGDFDKVEICDIEKEREGVSRTYDTVVELRKKFDHEFFWICGSDCLIDFGSWYKAKELAKEIEFIVYSREGVDIETDSLVKIVSVLDVDVDNVSSSEIRERIKNDCSVENLLPEKVLRHIKKMELYRNGVD